MMPKTLASLVLLLGLHTASAAAASTGASDPASWPSGEDLAERRELSASGRQLVSGFFATQATASELVTAMGLDSVRFQNAVLGGPAAGAGVLANLGILEPLEGASMAILSTGVAEGGPLPEPGTDFVPEGTSGDQVFLSFQVSVPPGPGTISFNYRFLTAEYPEFILAGFNDTFLATVHDDSGTRTIGQVSVDSASLFPANAASAAGSGYDLFTEDPAEIDDVFGPSGFPDAGLTDFLVAKAPFESSSGSITLTFRIEDGGDGLLDSAVLLDNLVVSTLDLVDVNPDLLSNGSVVTDRALLATLGSPVVGAAADGVTRLLARIRTSGPGEVTFSVDGRAFDDGGFDVASDPLPVESVTVEVGGDDFAFAVYHAPDGLERTGSDDRAERLVTLRASFQPAGGGAPLEAAKTLKLVRPPVVLVHGLWSRPGTWKLPLASDPRFRVKRFVDYERTNARIFAVNLRVVEREIRLALRAYRNQAIAVTQVDAVGHSMGGLLSRLYTNRPDYRRNDNLNAGDVRRILTLDSPHTGSPLANLLLEIHDQPFGLGLLADLAFEILRMPIGQGAIRDLAKGSEAISGMEASEAPGQALVGTGGSDLLLLTPGPLGSAYRTAAFFASVSASELFEGLEHDALVGRRSQEGGLDPSFVSIFGGTDGLHIGKPEIGIPGNTASTLYSDRLLELLRFREATSFQAFPAPASLASAAHLPEGALTRASRHLSGASAQGVGLEITSPAPGAEVTPGTTVTVIVEPLPAIDVERVLVIGPETAATDQAAPFEVELELPPDLSGPVTLMAVGATASGEFYRSEELVLEAVPAAQLVALDLRPKQPIVFTPGEGQRLRAIGIYDDGVERDLTELGTVFISLDEAIVAVSEDGELIPGEVGLTAVLARKGDLQDSIKITVVDNPDFIFADGFETGDTRRWSQ